METEGPAGGAGPTPDVPTDTADTTGTPGTTPAAGAVTPSGPASGTTPGAGSGLGIRALATAGVLDADGRRVGRVHDVFLQDRTGDLAAVSVALGRLAVREVLVPADLLRDAGRGAVQVPVRREVLRAGMATPAEGHVGPAGIREARAALGLADAEGQAPVKAW